MSAPELSAEQLHALRLMKWYHVWANRVPWEMCRELATLGLCELAGGDGHVLTDAGRAVLAGAK